MARNSSSAQGFCYTGSKQEAQARWQNTARGIPFKTLFLEAAMADDIHFCLGSPPPTSFLLPGKLLGGNFLQIFSRKLCQYEKHGLEVLVGVQRTLRACFTRFGVVGIVETLNRTSPEEAIGFLVIQPAKLLQ